MQTIRIPTSDGLLLLHFETFYNSLVSGNKTETTVSTSPMRNFGTIIIPATMTTSHIINIFFCYQPEMFPNFPYQKLRHMHELYVIPKVVHYSIQLNYQSEIFSETGIKNIVLTAAPEASGIIMIN